MVPAESTRLELTVAAASAPDEAALQVTAGDALHARVRVLDAYDNIVTASPPVHVTLEAELRPQLDEALCSASHDGAKKHPLVVRAGRASTTLPTRVAGELLLRLVQPSLPIDTTSSVRSVRVCAAEAVTIDVVNIPEVATAPTPCARGAPARRTFHQRTRPTRTCQPARCPTKAPLCRQAGRAGLAFELVLHARDKFGNVDEAFEREVALDQDGNLPPGELTMEHAGVVRLERGRARMLVNRKPPAPGQLISLTGLNPTAAAAEPAAGGLPARPSLRRNPSQRAV